MFSIAILTYNEEKTIACCLNSIKWCDDIVVIDSFSSDDTLEICMNKGVRVVQNKFVNFATQRNFALDSVDFKYDWVFHLDSDEHFNIKLKEECEQEIKKYNYGAFMVPSMTLLWGKWIKKSSNYPIYQMRFHKLHDARFIQYGHGQRESDLKKGLGFMKNPYSHFAFEKGLTKWFIKHIGYAQDEAMNNVENSTNFSMKHLFSKDKIVFRRNLKALSSKLPFRAFFKFFYMYVIRLGFLDGKAGLIYILMLSIYEQIIQIKEYEYKMKEKGINT